MPGTRQQCQRAAVHVRVNLQHRLRDHRPGEVEPYMTADDSHFDPPGHDPAAISLRITVLAVDPDHVLRLRSLCACGTTRAAGRSLLSAASSPTVRAISAFSSRESSSSAVSRPSPAATRSTSATRSRSSCDARSSPGEPASSPRPGDNPARHAHTVGPSHSPGISAASPGRRSGYPTTNPDSRNPPGDCPPTGRPGPRASTQPHARPQLITTTSRSWHMTALNRRQATA